MADECRDIPPSSTDREVNLVKSYCDIYDQLAVEAQNLRWSEKLRKLDEMAGVLNQIKAIPRNGNTAPVLNSSAEMMEDIPFSILSWTMKMKTLHFHGLHKPKTEDTQVPLSQIPVIEKLSRNQYQATLDFDGQIATVNLQYSGNLLIVSYSGYQSEPIVIDHRRKLIQQRMPNGRIERFRGTDSISLNIWDIQDLRIGNFR